MTQGRKFSLFLFLTAVTIFFTTSRTQAAVINNIAFQQTEGFSKLFIEADSPMEAIKSIKMDGRQIVLDVPNASLPGRLSRPFDTSEFPGRVILITPISASENSSRIVLQLREPAEHRITPTNTGFIFEVENYTGGFNEVVADSEDAGEGVAPGDTADTPPDGLPMSSQQSPGSKVSLDSGNIPMGDILENLSKSGEKKYIGQRITLNLGNASIAQSLKFLSRVSGFNIVFSSAAAGTPPITLYLEEVPWDQALDMILELNNLVATRSNNILNIRTFQELTAQKTAEASAKKQVIDLQPLVTRIHKISYATGSDISPIITPYLTQGRGSVQTDSRTDSLIVVDTVDVQEKIAKVISILDTQTPQILVEAKIVEAKEDFARTIGIDKNFSLTVRTAGESSDDTEGLLSISPINGTIGFSGSNIKVRGFGRIESLTASLIISETEGKVDIISNPKLVTQNNVSATIVAQDKKIIQTATTGATGDTVSETVTLDLPTTLTVTPKVTGEGSIDMTINIQRTSVIPAEAGVIPDTESRSVQTRVLVANGGTVVLGGMYQNNYTESAVTGVPILRHIPIIGFLFRTPHAISESKRELLVFITPKILNVEEAGFTVQKERSIDLPGAGTDSAELSDDTDSLDDISSESLLETNEGDLDTSTNNEALLAPEEASAAGSELEELTSSSLEGEAPNELESQEVEELEKLDGLEDIDNLENL